MRGEGRPTGEPVAAGGSFYAEAAGKQLEKSVLGDIKAIRDALASGNSTPQPAPRRGAVTQNTRPDLMPQAIQARPQQPWVAAKPDPIMLKLDELIKAIEELSSLPENRAAVPRLESVMGRAIGAAEELNSVHRLSTLHFASGTSTITFEPILQKMLPVAYYYAHLAFCMTPEGQAWIRGVMELGKVGDGLKQRLRVKSHRLVENLTHDGAETFAISEWKEWYLANVEGGKDPIEHFVDYLLLIGFKYHDAGKARLAVDGDERGVALARVRDGLPGSKEFPPKSLPRIFTFQVKVQASKGDLGSVGQWWAIPTRFLENTVGPAVLRPLEIGADR